MSIQRPVKIKAFASWLIYFASLAMSATALAAGTIKIAFINPLSGSFANVGEANGRAFQLAIEAINARGGVLGQSKFELVPLDSKTNPQDALLALKQAIDQGVHYVTQGNGSNVANALSEAIAKHNARNPDQIVLYLKYAAVDPALTNERCTFWHFRFDADADMEMAALTDAIAQNENIKTVYLINQDYSFGQAVARAAREQLAKKRPDIRIVGDELHPLGKVKDFAPYIAKIKASGADTVITGNWGNGMMLLVKASNEVGFQPEFYTYLRQSFGHPLSDWRCNAGPSAPSNAVACQHRQRIGCPTRDGVETYSKVDGKT